MQIEPTGINWQVVAYLVGGAITAIWALGKLLVRSFEKSLKVQFDAIGETLVNQDKEFAAIKRQLEKQEDADRALERELAAMRTEQLRDFVRREDFTRVIATFQVTVDNLRLSIERFYFNNHPGSK